MKMLTSGQFFLGTDKWVAMSWWYSEPHFFCVWEAPLLLRRFTQVPSALLGTASGHITSTLNWQKKQSHTSTLLLHCYLYICFHFYIYVVIRCHLLPWSQIQAPLTGHRSHASSGDRTTCRAQVEQEWIKWTGIAAWAQGKIQLYNLDQLCSWSQLSTAECRCRHLFSDVFHFLVQNSWLR